LIARRARSIAVLSLWRMVMMLVPARMTPSSNASWVGSMSGGSSPRGVRLLGFAIGAVMRRHGLTPAR